MQEEIKLLSGVTGELFVVGGGLIKRVAAVVAVFAGVAELATGSLGAGMAIAGAVGVSLVGLLAECAGEVMKPKS